MTPKGQMSSNGSGPAIMMMPPHIRATFMPDPPLHHLPPPKRKRPKIYADDNNGKPLKGGVGLTGVAAYMAQFERGPAPKRTIQNTPKAAKAAKAKKREEKWKVEHAPILEEYRKEQRECAGEFMNMNCYNTLFVGRLAYEVTERKLLREFEAFGPVKDVKLVTVKNSDDPEKEGKSRGYAFVEFEQEDDMKRAYRSADAMKIEGKEIVVDVERGHTVPNWLPRRLGGGLGGTRLGGKDKNVTRPGRYDPSKPDIPPPGPSGHGYGNMNDQRGPPMGGGYGGDYGYGGGGYNDRGPPGRYDRGPPPGRYDRGPPPGGRYGGGGGGGYNDRRGPPPGYYNDGPPGGRYGSGPRGGYGGDRGGMKRNRSRSPDRRDSRRFRY
eukprot:CAMPEP_0204620950 /NCGR_PEP_ID=MMETSP0717-20131115/6828_1 /ASSEMBLY_ACC=CAM_ASM_000666 /TAXON_ID=230516 /ORGANISM="Chaetoceros curvisetus" /LENGTH=379 /DNA_ID=CAMNT_0051635263 /DNA_START=23 /DNA_END=1162 /DNA_ORIENTATION=+